MHRFYFKLTALGGAPFSVSGIVPRGQPRWTFLSSTRALPLPGLPRHKGAFPWLGRHQGWFCSFGQHNHWFMESEQAGAGPMKVPGTSTASAHHRGWNNHRNLSHTNTELHSLKCHINHSIITNPEEAVTTWIQEQQIQNKPHSIFHFHFKGWAWKILLTHPGWHPAQVQD